MKTQGSMLTMGIGALLWAAPLWASSPPAPPAPGTASVTAPASVSATEDIRDIRGPVPIPPWWRWLALGGGAVALAGAGVAAVVVVRRRRAKPLEPHERALLRLEQAQPLAVAGQMKSRPCYFDLAGGW